MKLSRDESGASLMKKVAKVGYFPTRQKGSHIRLTRINGENEHHLTIPLFVNYFQNLTKRCVEKIFVLLLQRNFLY